MATKDRNNYMRRQATKSKAKKNTIATRQRPTETQEQGGYSKEKAATGAIKGQLKSNADKTPNKRQGEVCLQRRIPEQ